MAYAATGMATSDWWKISDSAKAVVEGLLRVDPNDRMGMPELRSHPWLAEHIVPLQRERGSGVDTSRQDGGAQSKVSAEPDADLLGSLNYLACCVNPLAAATQPTDGLCLHVSNGYPTDKKAGTPPAVVTIMIENGAAYIAPGSHLSMPLGMVACSRVQILRWLSGNGPLVRELPANWFACIVYPHGHGRSLSAPVFTTCRAGVLLNNSHCMRMRMCNASVLLDPPCAACYAVRPTARCATSLAVSRLQPPTL